MDDKTKAIIEFLTREGDFSAAEIAEELKYMTNNERYKIKSHEYMVLTDTEAEELWEEYLNDYLEKCILPQLPKNLAYYFDGELWKYDVRFDGRGHCLATYDGEEHEVKINNTQYYIYRT